MNLKEKINADFIAAYKEKNIFKKTVLGMLKTKITEAEKKDGKELTDSEILSVISSSIKQVDQSIEAFKLNPQAEEKVIEATKEKDILSEYLPTQMTDKEIKSEVLVILEDMIFPPEQSKRALGAIMSHFKEHYNGRYNPVNLKSIIDEIFA